MIGIIRNIVLVVILSVGALTSHGAFAMNYNLKTSSNLAHVLSPSTQPLGVVDEEVEKIITNVKVFYNPIAEQITVTFKLNKQQVVSIKVMDALGSEVLNLANTRMDEGMQNLSYDTNSKLSTGFYFVRVTSGTETVVKRISVR